MLLRTVATFLLCLNTAQAVEIKYDSEETPYCGREVLKLSVKRLFPSAQTATVGSALPLGWSEGTVPQASGLKWALERLFHRAESQEASPWLAHSLKALKMGSRDHGLVLCVVDACARIEDHGEVIYLPLPQLQVRPPRLMGMRPSIEGHPGELAAKRDSKKPAARKKGREKIPTPPKKDGRSTEPETPSALIASTPQAGYFAALNWAADFWGEAARYLVALEMARPGFVPDADLVLMLDAIAPFAIKAEVHGVFFPHMTAGASDSFYEGAQEALQKAFVGRERILAKKIRQYGFDPGNIYSRSLQLITEGD